MPVPVSPLSSSVTSTAAEAEERMDFSALLHAPPAPSTPLTASTPPTRDSALLVLQSAGVSLSLLSEKFAFHLTKTLLSSHPDTFTRPQLDAIHAATWSALIRAASDCVVTKSLSPMRQGFGTPQKPERNHSTANTTAGLSQSYSPAAHAHNCIPSSRSTSVLSTPQPNPSLKMKPTPLGSDTSRMMMEDSKSPTQSPSSTTIRTPPSAKTAMVALRRGTPVRLFSGTAREEKENSDSGVHTDTAALTTTPPSHPLPPPPHTPPSRSSTPAASILRAPLDLDSPQLGGGGSRMQHSQQHQQQSHPSTMRVVSNHATPSALRSLPMSHASPARAKLLEESVRYLAFASNSSQMKTPGRVSQGQQQQEERTQQQTPPPSTTAATSANQIASSLSPSPAASPAKSTARPSSSPSLHHRPLHSDSDTDDEALLSFQMRVPDSPPRRGGYGNEKSNFVSNSSTHVPSYPTTPATPQDLSASMRSQLKYDRHRYSDVKQPKYVSDSDPDTSDYDY